MHVGIDIDKHDKYVYRYNKPTNQSYYLTANYYNFICKSFANYLNFLLLLARIADELQDTPIPIQLFKNKIIRTSKINECRSRYAFESRYIFAK